MAKSSVQHRTLFYAASVVVMVVDVAIDVVFFRHTHIHNSAKRTASNYPNDWSIPQDDNLWKSSKTQYDPCPPGWRVPDTDVWDFMRTDSFSGYAEFDDEKRTYEMPTDGRKRDYPANGYLHGNYISFLDTEGYYWSCSDSWLKFQVSAIEPWYNNFSITYLTTPYFGCGIRCQKIE